MSVQNNLKKPTFTKSVMGYTQNEVDRYVDHVNERYNSVCRENAELKRRVMALGVRLDEAEAKLAEAEKNSVTKKVLDKSALREVFAMLEEEKARYACYVDSLMDKLNSMAAEESEESEEDADSDWEEALRGFIEEAPAETAEEAEISHNSDDTAAAPEAAEESAVSPVAEAMDEEEEKAEEISAEETDETPAEEERAPAVQKTPAEIAAELDFYTDDVHRDGESFDPMTLAAQITSQKRKPTFADFMNPLPADDNERKNK